MTIRKAVTESSEVRLQHPRQEDLRISPAVEMEGEASGKQHLQLPGKEQVAVTLPLLIPEASGSQPS